jgi:hypothetical protein
MGCVVEKWGKVAQGFEMAEFASAHSRRENRPEKLLIV